MGDRGSIQVVNGKDKSVVLFKHWGGNPEEMVGTTRKAFDFVKDYVLKENSGKGTNLETPYSRGDVGVIIALLTKIAVEEIGSSAYLGKTENDGDNSDNGHFILEIKDDGNVWEFIGFKMEIRK